jgi:hypothetical protein
LSAYATELGGLLVRAELRHDPVMAVLAGKLQAGQGNESGLTA